MKVFIMNFRGSNMRSLWEGAQLVEKALGYKTIKHILNSAGIVRFPEYRLDMVRLGIGLYGVEATGQDQRALQSVGTLKTIVSQIKYLSSGETVGYSRKGIADHDSAIATLRYRLCRRL